jgi:hypothetical protein
MNIPDNDSIYYEVQLPNADTEDMRVVQLPSRATPLDTCSTAGTSPTKLTIIYDVNTVRKRRPRITTPFNKQNRRGARNIDFHQYLQHLPQWEAELLDHVTMTHDIYTTYDKMQQTFHAAGDGSVKYEHQGAFGWIISTSSGERLATNYGPVRGHRPTSYRAEGYGVLSIVRFLKTVQEFCDVTPTWKWTLSSDNISLVNKLNGIEGEEDEVAGGTVRHGVPQHDWAMWQTTNENDLEDPTDNWTPNENTPTNMSLEPDWDVINEIRWTLDNDSVEGGSIFHILGHQDRKKPYTELSLQAQLNVDADGLATQYQEMHGKPLPHVLLFPHTSAQLNIDSLGTCTYRLPQTMRRAETDTPLYDYIVARNGWTRNLADAIDWDAHGRAIKKQNKKRIHITKLVHDILPTNAHIHRGYPQMQCCIMCGGVTIEDRDHILRCPHSARAQWRADTIKILEIKCIALNTERGLARILVQGLCNWLNQQEPPNPAEYPQKYNKLIYQQNAMGWRQLVNGRMSREWARIQADHTYVIGQRGYHDSSKPHISDQLRSQGRNQPAGLRSSSTWTTEIITTVWEQWALVWTMRNADIHGHNEDTRSRQRDRLNRQRLETIYEKKMQMEPSIRDLLYNTVEEHMQHSQRTVQNWLAVHEETIAQSIKHAATRAIQGMRSIRSFFRDRDTQSTNHSQSTQSAAPSPRHPSADATAHEARLHN